MKEHILLVEDDDDTRLIIACRLQYAGYRVTQAPDGETAVELLEKEYFHVVLTDIIMQSVSGIEVLHTAKIQPYHPAVILLTGHGALNTAIAAVREGAFDYLLKPCPSDELLACIQEAVQRHYAEQQLSNATNNLLSSRIRYQSDETSSSAYSMSNATHPTTTIHLGTLIVGPSRQEVTLQGKSLHMTPIEFAILCFLVEKVGVTRRYSDIVFAAHNLQVSEEEAQAMLKTHIRNLRKKIGSQFIQTERGIGYKMVDPTEDSSGSEVKN